MARNNRFFGNNTRTNPVDPPAIRTMQLSEQAFQVLREHAAHYYSSPTYDEVLVNLVKFYESNGGPKYFTHYNNVNIMTID